MLLCMARQTDCYHLSWYQTLDDAIHTICDFIKDISVYPIKRSYCRPRLSLLIADSFVSLSLSVRSWYCTSTRVVVLRVGMVSVLLTSVEHFGVMESLGCMYTGLMLLNFAFLSQKNPSAPLLVLMLVALEPVSNPEKDISDPPPSLSRVY